MTDDLGAKEDSTLWQPPTEEEIRSRAYELYLERERAGGGPTGDWLEAEAELFLTRERTRNDLDRKARKGA